LQRVRLRAGVPPEVVFSCLAWLMQPGWTAPAINPLLLRARACAGGGPILNSPLTYLLIRFDAGKRQFLPRKTLLKRSLGSIVSKKRIAFVFRVRARRSWTPQRDAMARVSGPFRMGRPRIVVSRARYNVGPYLC